MELEANQVVANHAKKMLTAGYRPVVNYPKDFTKSGGKATTGKEPFGSSWGEKEVTSQTIDKDVGYFDSRGVVAGLGIALGPGRAPDGKGLGDLEGDGPAAPESLAKLFGGEVVETLGHSSVRGGHVFVAYDWARLEPILKRLAGYLVKDANQPGVYHDLPGLPDLELRLGGYKESGKIKQLQSVIPPTPGSTGVPRRWNGCKILADAPESLYQFLEQIARQAAAGKQRRDQAAHAVPAAPGPDLEKRVIAYLATIEPAVSGQGGHNKTFGAACRVGPGFDLAPETAFRLIRDHYNTRCEPPWSDMELRHKVEDAYKKEPRRGWLLDALSRNGRPIGQRKSGSGGEPKREKPIFSNKGSKSWKNKNGEDEEITFALNVEEIDASLERIVPGWPKRVGDTLFVPDNENRPKLLTSPSRLFAWIDEVAQVDWMKGVGKYIGTDRYYEHKRMTSERFDAIEFLPHWPMMEGVYYMHNPVPRKTGSALTDQLLAFFSPATDVDRELIRAFILTLFWGGPSGGRPAFMVTSEDEGLDPLGIGKSTLMALLTEEFVGNCLDVSPTDKIADVKTRLLSKEGRQKRVARLDNLKTFKFSWADLEGLITSPLISGHDLYKGEGERPNTIVWTITLNGANLSRDMAQRVIVIYLKRPKFDPLWAGKVREFIRTNRQGLLGEIRVALEDDPGVTTPTRWSSWEREVLSKVTLPEQCQKAIAQRQGGVDVDAEDSLEVEWFFRQRIHRSGYDPDEAYLFIRSRVIASWLELATGERWPTNRASAHIKTLRITTLRKSARDGWPGWVWTGKNKKVKPNESPEEFVQSSYLINDGVPF
jgi:hypothetical protein